MLALDQIPLSCLYSPSPFHRYQAEALLRGHLALSDSIEAVQLGLVWYHGHVQHVWGLGVGLWLLPFQAAWRLFGGEVFPDRIALGIAFSLLGFYAVCTGWELMRRNGNANGLGLVWLIVLYPPLWTLTRASVSVFEQTILYADILSLGILISLVRAGLFDRTGDYIICVVLSSFAVFVRPTHAVYGLMAVLICSAILIVRGRRIKMALIACSVYALAFGLLATTNYVRFGSPTEFGHRLTVTTGNMVFIPRFGSPFKAASTPAAAGELAGLLFSRSGVGIANSFSDGMFPGQSSVTRWRKLDITAYDASYAIAAVLAVAISGFWLFRKRHEIRALLFDRSETLVGMLVCLWSCGSFLGLACFYLHYPLIASRYLFDFAPCFAGFLIALWFFVPRRFLMIALPLLGAWLICEISFAKFGVKEIKQYPVTQTLPRMGGESALTGKSGYSIANPPTEADLSWNRRGWDMNDGFADDVVVLAVDKPQFVELEVSQRRGENGEAARPDLYGAMIDGTTLPLRTIVPQDDNLRVIFDIPKALQGKLGKEALFLCFSESYDRDDRQSERILYSVRWR